MSEKAFLKLVLIGVLTSSLFGKASVLLAGGVNARLDPQAGELGDEFSLSIVVEGNLDAAIQLPSVPGLEISEGGKSSSVTIINGQMSATATYYYQVAATREGDYVIPAFTVKVDGRQEQLGPLALKVRPGGRPSNAAGNSASGSGTNDSGDQPPGSVQEGAEGLPLAFVERRISRKDPYEGEPVISTVKIFTRTDVNGLQKAAKDSPDFRYEEIGQSNGRERIGEAVYEVITYQEVLVPQKSGEIELPPYQLDAQLVVPQERRQRGGDLFSEFFGRGFGKLVKKRLSSQPITMHVKPLPKEGQPAGYKGLVGNFQLESQLSQSKLKQGETATLTITIKGSGALDPLGQSLDLGLGRQLKVYPDKPDTQSKATAEHGIYSRRIYKFALVPTQGGLIPLGQLHIANFNPKSGQYEVLSADLGNLEVEAVKEERVVVTASGSGGQTNENQRASVEALAKDLVDLHRDVSLEAGLSDYEALSCWALFAVLPACAYGATVLVQLRRRRRAGDTAGMRRSTAYKSYRSERQSWEQQYSKDGDHPSPVALSDYHKLFRAYLGHRFNAHGGALTGRDIDLQLERLGFSAEQREQARKLAGLMDELAFGGRSLDSNQRQALVAEMDQLVREIEKT